MSNVRVRRLGSRARCVSSRSIRPRWSAMTGVSGGSNPCSTYISRMRCLADGFRLSVPRRCSMVFESTPSRPATRAPSASRTAVPSTLSVYVVAAEVRGVRHRWTPATVGAYQDVLVDERRVPRYERFNVVGLIAPDRVGELHRVDEPCPARRAVAPCEHEMRVRQLRARGVDRFEMMFAQFGDRFVLAGMDGAKE